jgi:hypothetical protein
MRRYAKQRQLHKPQACSNFDVIFFHVVVSLNPQHTEMKRMETQNEEFHIQASIPESYE